jgi:hypothetical protein
VRTGLIAHVLLEGQRSRLRDSDRGRRARARVSPRMYRNRAILEWLACPAPRARRTFEIRFAQWRRGSGREQLTSSRSTTSRRRCVRRRVDAAIRGASRIAGPHRILDPSGLVVNRRSPPSEAINLVAWPRVRGARTASRGSCPPEFSRATRASTPRAREDRVRARRSRSAHAAVAGHGRSRSVADAAPAHPSRADGFAHARDEWKAGGASSSASTRRRSPRTRDSQPR